MAKLKTRAEVIRSMSDEELATVIASNFGTTVCSVFGQSNVKCDGDCAGCILQWLTLPSDNDYSSNVEKQLKIKYSGMRGNHVPEWSDFETFYKFAINEGYEVGQRMKRHNTSEPYGPGNCSFFDEGFSLEADRKKWIDGWNTMINKIRGSHGLPPLPGTEGKSNT